MKVEDSTTTGFLQSQEEMANSLSSHLNKMSDKEFLQNVAFLQSDSIAIANNVWEKTSSPAVKQSRKLFSDEDALVSSCHFLAKNSEEAWYMRTNNGYLFGASTKLVAVKVAKTAIPPSLWNGLVNKIQAIVPAYNPDDEISIRKVLNDHFTEIYADKIKTSKKLNPDEGKDELGTEEALARSFETIRSWPDAKKARLIDLVEEMENE